MKFSTLIALVGSVVAVKKTATFEKCKYKIDGDVCVLLNENKQPFSCVEAPADSYMFKHTDTHLGTTGTANRCTW